MDHREMAKLSDAHWLALRLDDAGGDLALIARVLDLDIEAVLPLLEVARRKRASIASAPEPRRPRNTSDIAEEDF